MKAVPLRTAAWQTSMDDADLFQFDGTFEANAEVLGSWVQLGQVASVDAFDPAARLKVNRNAPFQTLTFKPDGRTDDLLVMYSGDLLLDLRRNQALTMLPQQLDGTAYLFIEAGGFKPDQMAD